MTVKRSFGNRFFFSRHKYLNSKAGTNTKNSLTAIVSKRFDRFREEFKTIAPYRSTFNPEGEVGAARYPLSSVKGAKQRKYSQVQNKHGGPFVRDFCRRPSPQLILTLPFSNGYRLPSAVFSVFCM